MAGLNEPLRVYGQEYFTEQAMNIDDSVTSDWLDTGGGGMNGSYEIAMYVDELIEYPGAAGNITVTLESGSTESTEDNLQIYTLLGGSAVDFEAGTFIFKYALPDTIKRYTRITLSVEDATMTGKASIFLQYQPR